MIDRSNPCPFCPPPADRILFEEPLVLAFWDGFPVSPGHALIIPRRHVASWFDATREEQAALLAGLGRARNEIEKHHHADGFNIGVNVGEAAGQTVFHLHMHLIPRYRGDVRDPRGGVRHVIPHKANYQPSVIPGADLLSGAPHHRALIAGAPDHLLPHLKAHLSRANSVDIAVAFTMSSGVSFLEEHLRDLLKHGGRIRFLTGDYLNVTEPGALRRLLDLEGSLNLRVFETRHGSSFHPKAYILKESNGAGTAFVGSSNLTATALNSGLEWNYRVVTSADPAGFAAVTDAFESLFDHPATRSVDEPWIAAYQARRKSVEQAEDSGEVSSEDVEPPPSPHRIQREALEALVLTRARGNAAGLVVLATGLGKTWLAAFDANRPEFRRILFVAHRDEILGQSIKAFRRIRPDAVLGRYDGNQRDSEADILFASIMTLSRAPHLNRFRPDHFDYIVVDEFHHAAAASYRNLIGHFRPRFLLGLSKNHFQSHERKPCGIRRTRTRNRRMALGSLPRSPRRFRREHVGFVPLSLLRFPHRQSSDPVSPGPQQIPGNTQGLDRDRDIRRRLRGELRQSGGQRRSTTWKRKERAT